MADTPKKRATYADVEAAPEHLVAEIINGELMTHPRPSPRHGATASSLGNELTGPFQKGRGGPGGWVFFVEPEIKFAQDLLVPDIAAWRRERLTAYPEKNYFTIAPDWVCEVLSASTEALDRGKKLGIYAREGVTHVWLVNPILRTLEVLFLARGVFRLTASHEGGANIRAAPFDAIELDLGALWV